MPLNADRVLHDESSDGALWARGRTYKARFDAESASYVPFLGSDAPHNFPVTFRVAAVTCGAAEVPFMRDGRIVCEGERVTIERGAFTEVYDLALDSIEQSFVVAEPLQGALRFTIDVESELVAESDAEGIRFSNELGGVRYGAATLRDADGRATELPTHLLDGRIVIDVDAGVLAAARFPIVVDPLVSTFGINLDGFDNFAADVAYEPTLDAYLVPYESAFSATDHDVGFNLLNASGGGITANAIDVTSEDWRDVGVASLNGANQFLVVAERSPGEVVGRTVTGSGAALGAKFVIGQFYGEGGSYEPTVGGDPFTGLPSYYCVAYEELGSLVYQLVRPDSTLLFANAPVLPVAPQWASHNPSISKSDNADRWTVVVEDRSGLPAGQSRILGAQIFWDGSIATPPFTIANGGLNSRPCVSSMLDDHRFLVAWERGYPSMTQHDIDGRLFHDGTPLDFEINLTNLTSANIAQDQIEPRLDSDGRQFVLAYSESYQSSTTDYDPYLSPLGVSGTRVLRTDTTVVLSFTAKPERRPSIASTRGGGGAMRRYLYVWDDVPVGQSQHDVWGAAYDSPVGGTKVSYFCNYAGEGSIPCPCSNDGAAGNGCGNSVFAVGARLTATGDASASADSLVLVGTNLPNGPALYFQGTATSANYFGDGFLCVSGAILRLGIKTASLNTSSYPQAGDPSISAQGLIPTAGGTRYYQAWYRDAATYCTTATYNLTQGVIVDWTN